MFRLLYLLLILLVCTISLSTFAEDCNSIKKNLKKIVDDLNNLNVEIDDLYLDCLFSGPRDIKIKRISRRLISSINEHTKMNELTIKRVVACTKISFSANSFLESLGRSSGKAFGRMAMACSLKGQEILNSNLTEKEKEEETTKLLKNYLK